MDADFAGTNPAGAVTNGQWNISDPWLMRLMSYRPIEIGIGIRARWSRVFFLSHAYIVPYTFSRTL
jgi:hypothetical protein